MVRYTYKNTINVIISRYAVLLTNHLLKYISHIFDIIFDHTFDDLWAIFFKRPLKEKMFISCEQKVKSFSMFCRLIACQKILLPGIKPN